MKLKKNILFKPRLIPVLIGEQSCFVVPVVIFELGDLKKKYF